MSLRAVRRELVHALNDLEGPWREPVHGQVGGQAGPWQDDVRCARRHLEAAVMAIRAIVGEYPPDKEG